MPQDTITLKEMIDSMDAGEVFSIGFRTCNRHKQTGGEYIEIKQACKQHYQFSHRGPQPKQETGYKRNPRHYENGTRNIREMPMGNIVKVHLRLIRRFNSKIVM